MASPSPVSDVAWRGLPEGLLQLRRTLLLLVGLPVVLVTALAGALVAIPLVALCPLPAAVVAAGWVLLGRNWRSWRYALREDDLLISHGVLLRRETIVPYGRMQLVEVTSGPLLRQFGLAQLQLHTAAAATDAGIPGLHPDEATALRDRLAELGEARSAGL